MEIIKGGMRIGAANYIEPVQRFAIGEIRNRRDSIPLPKDTLRGGRFNNDEAILWRLESNYTEEEFMSCPGLAVDAMLIAAAGSDWWYTYEKEYIDRDYDSGDNEASENNNE